MSHTTATSAARHAGDVTSGSAIDRPHSRQVSAALSCMSTSINPPPSWNTTRHPRRASPRANAASSVMCPAASAYPPASSSAARRTAVHCPLIISREIATRASASGGP